MAEATSLITGRPPRGDLRRKMPVGVSDGLLHYVQACQVAVLTCADEDYVAQVVSIWSCLAAFPKRAGEADRLAASMAVCRIAKGFFAADRRLCRPDCPGATVRRGHVNRLLRFVREQFANPDLTLGFAAKNLGLSIAFLSRALSAETARAHGSAFRSHLNGIRVLAAVERLRDSVPVRDIAMAVGYTSTGELDRQFARWFRLTPREFRSLLKRNPTIDCG